MSLAWWQNNDYDDNVGHTMMTMTTNDDNVVAKRWWQNMIMMVERESLVLVWGEVVLSLLLDTASPWRLHVHFPTPGHSCISTSLFVQQRQQHLISLLTNFGIICIMGLLTYVHLVPE
jgi:hypothetical protein